MVNNILIVLVIIVIGLLTNVVSKELTQIAESVKELNNKLAGADIRIDICLNEQAALQDSVEAKIALVQLDLEGIQYFLNLIPQRGHLAE